MDKIKENRIRVSPNTLNALNNILGSLGLSINEEVEYALNDWIIKQKKALNNSIKSQMEGEKAAIFRPVRNSKSIQPIDPINNVINIPTSWSTI